MKSRGYTLVALMIGITVMTVLIAAVLPLASTEAQRDKEAELIFRGRQYAEAIRIFRRRYGRYPNTLKELIEVKPRSIRKLWKDPITSSEQWGLIGTTMALPGQTRILGGPGGGSRPTPTPAPTPVPTPRPGGPPGSGLGQPPAGPITGVYSLSRKKAFRLYDGRDVYADWKFTEASLGLAGQGGVPGPGISGGPDLPPPIPKR